MDLVNMNGGVCNILCKKLPEQYFIQTMDHFAVLILRFIYMSFRLQIFVCHLDQFQHLMTALDYRQIKNSNTAL
jgi:hypothetical protein